MRYTVKALGRHFIVELYECDSELINDTDAIKDVLLESVKISGAEIIRPVFHKFSPHGVTGIVVIAESHFSIHTWPEYGYCAFDIFTCGDSIDNERAIQHVREKLKARAISVSEIKRGILNLPGEEIRYKPDE
jgi:S-adenosylmethionine decarboxylase